MSTASTTEDKDWPLLLVAEMPLPKELVPLPLKVVITKTVPGASAKAWPAYIGWKYATFKHAKLNYILCHILTYTCFTSIFSQLTSAGRMAAAGLSAKMAGMKLSLGSSFTAAMVPTGEAPTVAPLVLIEKSSPWDQLGNRKKKKTSIIEKWPRQIPSAWCWAPMTFDDNASIWWNVLLAVASFQNSVTFISFIVLRFDFPFDAWFVSFALVLKALGSTSEKPKGRAMENIWKNQSYWEWISFWNALRLPQK